MDLLIFIISLLGSTSSGLFGVILWQKHTKKLLTSKTSFLDFIFGDPTIASLLIVALGAGGFWLPSVLLPDLLKIEKVQKEEIMSDRKPQSNSSFSIGE